MNSINTKNNKEKRDATFIYQILGIIIGVSMIFVIVICSLNHMKVHRENLKQKENQQKNITN